jgi:membrane protein implicated in regulation of membrane protease activity
VSSIGLLTQATTHSPFQFTPPWFWLVAGVILCLIEFFLRKIQTKKYQLMALIMGLSALILSLLLWGLALAWNFDWQYIMYEDFNLQIIFWMGMSTTSIIWLRPAFIKRKTFTIPQATEAKTLTEILPGETGRVIYEGSFWQARCAEHSGAIAPNQTVYVLRYEGNTLIVASETLFRD